VLLPVWWFPPSRQRGEPEELNAEGSGVDATTEVHDLHLVDRVSSLSA
jgi:hypothetical protein